MGALGPAFITGGSSGIGLELARALAAKGHDVALFARDAGRLQTTVQRLKSEFPDVLITAYPVDVSNRQQTEMAVAMARAALGPPQWAIANAGIAVPGKFLDQDIAAHETQMATNYMGALYFAKAAAPLMQDTGGHLVFVSSGAAFFGIYGYSAYAPSKFAMRGLAEILRVELAPKIKVSLAYPPDTDTPQLAAETATKPEATKEITAGGGLWQPDKVAALIVKRAGRGKFAIAPGFQMAALLALHSLLGPVLRFWQARLARKHR